MGERITKRERERAQCPRAPICERERMRGSHQGLGLYRKTIILGLVKWIHLGLNPGSPLGFLLNIHGPNSWLFTG